MKGWRTGATDTKWESQSLLVIMTLLLWTRGTAVVPCSLNTVTELQRNYSLLCRRNIFRVQEHLWLVLKLLQPRLGHDLWFFCWQSQDLSVLHAHRSALLRESRLWLIRLEHGSASWTRLCNISSDSRHTDSWEVQFINIFTNHKYEQLRRTMISNVITFINIKSSLRQRHERRRLQSSVYGVFWDHWGIITTSKRVTADSVVLTGVELENQVHCKIVIIKNITDPFVSRKELWGAPGNTW